MLTLTTREARKRFSKQTSLNLSTALPGMLASLPPARVPDELPKVYLHSLIIGKEGGAQDGEGAGNWEDDKKEDVSFEECLEEEEVEG